MFLEWENNSEKLQIISGKFQKNAIKDVKQISLSHVITCRMQVNQIAKIHLKLEAKIGDSLLYNASDCAKKETLMTRFLLKITLLPTKMGNLNDTHRENCWNNSIQEFVVLVGFWLLVAQTMKIPLTFNYKKCRCLNKVLHQIDRKWAVAYAFFYKFYGKIWLDFCLY